jgi:hypothetical protein
MNIKQITIYSITATVMFTGSSIVFAADTAKEEGKKEESVKTSSIKKPLGKVTCQDFIMLDDIIKPQYLIAASEHSKSGKPQNTIVDIVDTDTLVPVMVEECEKQPTGSFWDKLKSKLKH